MKVKLFHFPLFFLLLAPFFFACEKEKTATAGYYSEGVFVVNEGPGSGTGTITWHNPATGETVQDVFGKANDGAALGQYVQSLTLHNGKGYVIASGANKVYVVDALSFKYLDTIGGLILPRFMLPIDDHTALISQWGAGGLNGSVAKIDLTTLEVIQTIPAGAGPDKMIRLADGLVAVPNSGGFGVDSTVSILNADNTAEQDRIIVPGKNPGSVALAGIPTANLGALPFVHCQGYYKDNPPEGWVGPLYGTGHIIPAYGNDLVSAPDFRKLYFAAGGKIYVLDNDGLRTLVDQPAWGLGCDPATGNLYCGDAKTFDSPGEVVIYSPAGVRVGAFECGVIPGEFVFIR